MGIQLLLFALGLCALYLGADGLVRGAARLARAYGVSALAVGLTIVAFGTSAPELVVSGVASVRGQGGVAIGNVIGSNIVNLGLILGIASLIRPLRVEMRLVAREVPLVIATALAMAALGWDGRIGRAEAALLLAGFAAYLAFVLRVARLEPTSIEVEYRQFEAAETLEPRGEPRWWDAGLVVGGLGGLALGAHWLVGAAVQMATALGVSDVVIGLTIVAVGTSLPELATSLVAALRGESDIAAGNILGSNIFNSLGILGVAAGLRPLEVTRSLLQYEIPVMILLSALLLPLAWTRLRVERWEGALLVGGYVAFLGGAWWRAAGAG